jgi:Cu(I)/Ag(I) efflux system protein CusF
MKLHSLITVAALSLSGTVFAQNSTADHSAHHPPAASAAAAPTSDGEVRKVDMEQGKVTLKHGPIANLDMPGMTMVFKVADPKLLDNLKPGAKVKFAASNMDGAITVTAIEMAK